MPRRKTVSESAYEKCYFLVNDFFCQRPSLILLARITSEEALAARLGLEPRQAESESAVLPLHHQAVEREMR